MTAKEQTGQIRRDKVSIMHLTRKFANELAKHKEFAGTDVLSQGLVHNILQSIRFRPRSVRLVAYHNKDKTAIGFIALKHLGDKRYVIEDVLVDPKYRKIGVATRLLNHAIALAKEKGATGVNLEVEINNNGAINLYKKCGFKELGRTITGQKYESGFRFKAIKRALIGHGFLAKMTIGKDSRLVDLDTNSKRNRATLFRIYQSCIDQGWIDFFEIDVDNLIEGSVRVWNPPFFRNVLINEQLNTFAIIVHYPFSPKAAVRVYSMSNNHTTSMLDDLSKTLANRGIPFTQITVFNSDKAVVSWFKEKRMRVFKLITMGKTLK